MSTSWLARIKGTLGKDGVGLVGAALFLLLALLVFFWPAVFGGRVLLPADLIFDLDPLWQPLAPRDYAGPSNALLADQVYQFHPWALFTRRSLAGGAVPLWNPHTDGGLPFVGNAQSAVFSPFRLIGYLFPLHVSYATTAILRLFVAGIFTFLLAREIGVGVSGALLAMVTFTFSGPMVMWLGFPHSSVVVWLPAMLFTTERTLTRRNGRYVMLSALTIGVQFLGGHPETSFHVMLVWAAYALYRTGSLAGWEPSRWRPKLKRISAAALTGGLLAAVQLLPFAETLLHSATLLNRATEASASTASFITQVLFDWREWPTLITTVLPQYFGTPLNDSYWFPYSNYVEQNTYAGVLPLVLACMIILRHTSHPDPRKRSLIRFFGATAIISLGVALHLPALNIINKLPLLNLVANERLRLVYAFAVSILAGLGMDRLIQRDARPAHRTVLHILLLLTAGSVLIAAVTYAGFSTFKDEVIQSGRAFMAANWGTPYLSRPLKYYNDLVVERYYKKLALFSPSNAIMYLPTFVTLSWTFINRWSRKRPNLKVWAGAVIGLTLLDVFWVGQPFNPTIEPEHVFPQPGAIQFLQQDTDIYRITGTGLTLNPNTGMVFGLSDIRGYDVVVPRRYSMLIDHLEGHYRFHFHSLFTDVSSPLLDLLNVKYALTDQALGGKWGLVYRGKGDVDVYRNRDCIPRAFIVYDAEIVGDAVQSLDRLLDSDFDYRTQVILEEGPPQWELPTAPAIAPAVVQISDYQANRVTIEVETAADGLLVLMDNYAPGWRASIDGQATDVYVANHAFRAVVVPAGHHRVEFVYRPWSFYGGATLSLLTLLGLSTALIVSQSRRVDQ